MDERERRELAEQHKDEIDIDSAQAIAPWPKPRGFTCEHVTMTSVPGVVRSLSTSYCSCEMQPIY